MKKFKLDLPEFEKRVRASGVTLYEMAKEYKPFVSPFEVTNKTLPADRIFLVSTIEKRDEEKAKFEDLEKAVRFVVPKITDEEYRLFALNVPKAQLTWKDEKETKFITMGANLADIFDFLEIGLNSEF